VFILRYFTLFVRQIRFATGRQLSDSTPGSALCLGVPRSACRQ
jgi:hypothetical protein